MRFFASALPAALFLAPALAAPAGSVEERGSDAAPSYLPNIKLPTSTLPAPPAGYVLKWLGLGVGTQNYTCASSSAAVIPVSNGAVATLYDLSSLNKDPMSSMKLPSIPPLALGASTISKNVLQMYLNLMGYQQGLGNHFFNLTMVPTFHLSGLKNPVPAPELFSKKIASMTAPASACKGTKGEGAVPWLYLEDVGTSISGVKAVYRMETAGGAAPANCAGQKPNIEVPYSAEYFFFGPQ